MDPEPTEIRAQTDACLWELQHGSDEEAEAACARLLAWCRQRDEAVQAAWREERGGRARARQLVHEMSNAFVTAEHGATLRAMRGFTITLEIYDLARRMKWVERPEDDGPLEAEPHN